MSISTMCSGEEEKYEYTEQDSTMRPNLAYCSFCPHRIFLGSAFPKPCVYIKREVT